MMNSSNNIEFERIEQNTTKIIKKRRRRLAGVGVASGGMALFLLITGEWIVATVLFLSVCTGIIGYIIDSINYPVPKLWYRKYNKIFYVFGSEVLLARDVSRIAGGVTSMASHNPVVDLVTNPNQPWLNGAIDVGLATIQSPYDISNYKGGKYVEAYFQVREQMTKINAAEQSRST